MQITAVTALLLFNMEIKVKIDENTIAVISTVTANNKTIFMSISKKPRSGIPMQRYGIKNAIHITTLAKAHNFDKNFDP